MGDGQWLVHNSDLCPIKWADSSLWQKVKASATNEKQYNAFVMLEKSGYNDMEVHALSVMHWSTDYAKHGLGYYKDMIFDLAVSSVMHDAGKSDLAVVTLFNSKRRFTNPERAIMATHTTIGANYLLENGFSSEIANVARYHHPKYRNEFNYSIPRWEYLDPLTKAVAPVDTIAASLSPVTRGYLESEGAMSPYQQFMRGRSWLYEEAANYEAIASKDIGSFSQWFYNYYGIKNLK